MRKADQAISIRDQILAAATERKLFDSLEDLGLRSIELHIGLDLNLPCIPGHSIGTDRAIQNLKRELKSRGVRPSAILIATDFSGADADVHVDFAVRVVHAAGELGCSVVRIDPLTARSDLSETTICGNFIHRASRILDQTRNSGVDLGMENHGPVFNDRQAIDRILEIGDLRFGLTLDTGNLYWWGHPLSEVYALIERYAPRTKHTHIKNINYPPGIAQRRREIGHHYKRYCSPLDSGSLDLRQVVKLLRQAGYIRDLCIENESLFKVPPEHRLRILRRDVDALRRAMQSA